jgi:hypothetical protein
MPDQLDFIIDAPSHFAVPPVRMPLSSFSRLDRTGGRAQRRKTSPQAALLPLPAKCPEKNLIAQTIYHVMMFAQSFCRG